MLLDPAADLVELGIGQLEHVKAVSYPEGVGSMVTAAARADQV